MDAKGGRRGIPAIAILVYARLFFFAVYLFAHSIIAVESDKNRSYRAEFA